MSEEEIEKISDNSWNSVLKDCFKANEDDIFDTTKTIRIRNGIEHQQYSSIRLDFKTESKSKIVDSEDSSSSEEEEEKSEHFAVPLDLANRLKPSEYYSKYIARTELECQTELAAPQRSQEWLNARKLSITASQFGSATGMSPYQTPDQLIVDKLWNTFQGNAATKWGTEHEEDAKSAFCAWFKKYLIHNGETGDFEFIEENLMKFADEPWMAVSPDGIVKYTLKGHLYTDLVEFKCPAYLRNTVLHPYAKHDNIPPHYMSQIQGVMGYINSHHPLWHMEKCWFVVWQPQQTWIDLTAFDPYIYDPMHEKLKSWYFNHLLPALTHKHNGLLAFGETHPQEVINLS